MGLIAETEAAAIAAQELNSAAVSDTSMVDEFAQAVSARHQTLVGEIHTTSQRLLDLENFLHGMDTALGSGLAAFQAAAGTLEGQVKQLHADLVQELDANDRAIQALVPQVQAALEEVEKAVGKTELGMRDLAEVQGRLVAQAQAAAAQAGQHAAQMLAAVTAELQELTIQSGELDINWAALSSQVDAQVALLQGEFDGAAAVAQKSLQEVLAALKAGSQEADQKVRQAFLVETLERFEQLSLALEEALVQLRELGKRPLELGETMQSVTQKLTETVSQPLALIRAIHLKADQTYNLFSFQYQ